MDAELEREAEGGWTLVSTAILVHQIFVHPLNQLYTGPPPSGASSPPREAL